MRIANIAFISMIAAPLVVGCASAAPDGRFALAGGDCPSFEGYPDCQDGHRVDSSQLASYDLHRDRASIRELQARYETAVEAKDAAAYSQLFTEDAVLQAANDVARGRKAIGAELAKSVALNQSHVVSNAVIRINGNTATSTSAWIALDHTVSSGHSQVIAYGHYEDEYTRGNRGWLFSKRTVVIS